MLILFGTRPEAIKMAPIIKEFRRRKKFFKITVCVTAQHREMLDRALEIFNIKPDYDLNLMRPNQTLPELTSRILDGVTRIIETEKPDWIFVQGDTTTTFASALAAFYQKIKIVHVEAGLRTGNKYSPFPEEINRRLTSHLADIHFAPTKIAEKRLTSEGFSRDSIFVTGNTVIDALKWIVEKQDRPTRIKKLKKFFLTKYKISFPKDVKTILVTGHRRENFGDGFLRICSALSRIAKRNNDIQIVYPVHLNPNVQKPVYFFLGELKNVHLIEPLDYEPFVFLMKSSYIILTDSGGIQEEAPFLGKPILVLRDTTERPEGIVAHTAKLIGTDENRIVKELELFLKNASEYKKMAKATNPYGNGNSADTIVNIFKNKVVKGR